MSTPDGSVCAALSEAQIDELIERLPATISRLDNNQKIAWSSLLRHHYNTHHKGYLGTREAALEGDQRCRQIMMEFVMLYLKERLSS